MNFDNHIADLQGVIERFSHPAHRALDSDLKILAVALRETLTYLRGRETYEMEQKESE
jgi:hypothetical protein